MEAVFQEKSMIAAAAGENTQKLEETAKESICYQVVKSLNGHAIGYVPQPYAGEMAELGAQFEKGIINSRQAIEVAEKIGDRLADELKMDLYLIQPIDPLSFMREKLAEFDARRQGLPGSSEPGTDETFKPDSSSTKTSTSKPPAVEKAVKKQSEAPPEDDFSWD